MCRPGVPFRLVSAAGQPARHRPEPAPYLPGGGDIAMVLPSNEHPDARCDVVRYVAISEVERHAGSAEVVAERRVVPREDMPNVARDVRH